jgi:aquaporin Z
VTFGLWVGRRFTGKDVGPYMVAQVIGAIAAAAILYSIASGTTGFSAADGFASNGYGDHSPGGYSLAAAIVAEFVLTLFFIFIIMGATDERAPKDLARLAIGLTLTLIHLISIPVTKTSVNPARSIGPAIFQGSWALSQLWLFIVVPLVGGAVGGALYHWLIGKPKAAARTA